MPQNFSRSWAVIQTSWFFTLCFIRAISLQQLPEVCSQRTLSEKCSDREETRVTQSCWKTLVRGRRRSLTYKHYSIEVETSQPSRQVGATFQTEADKSTGWVTWSLKTSSETKFKRQSETPVSPEAQLTCCVADEALTMTRGVFS